MLDKTLLGIEKYLIMKLNLLKRIKKIKNENYPNLICYPKSFFSTSLDKKLFLDLFKIEYLSKKEWLVLYEIISPWELDKNIVTNVDLHEIQILMKKKSYFPFF